jgi:hypothetical protein
MNNSVPVLHHLAERLSESDARRFELLLRVVRCPPAGDGLIIFMRQAKSDIDCVNSHASLQKLDRLHAWLARIEQELTASDRLPPHLWSQPDLKPLAPQYRMFFEPAKGCYRSEPASRIQTVQGLALAHAMASKDEIPESLASHWLRRRAKIT